MRAFVAVVLQFVLTPLLFGATPRLSFERTTPAEHDLGGAEMIAIVHSPDSPGIETFIETFIAQAERSRLIRMGDFRGSTGPADAYLAIQTLSCKATDRSGEGSAHDVDGNRVMRKLFWTETLCMARVDVMSREMRRLSSFYARGEGTSRRGSSIPPDERLASLTEAARFAGRDAAERITPRIVRESIELEPAAPAFEEGYAMIKVERFADARALWERTLRLQPLSAPLRFNLGAICEALGDKVAAERHYNTARSFAPSQPHYSNELKLFAIRKTTATRATPARGAPPARSPHP